MSLEANKALVRRFIEEVQSQHKLTAVDEIMDPNMIEHYGQPSSLNSVEAFKKFFAGFIAAFPDVKAVIHNQVAEGDKVVTHKTFHGTHKGEFMGIPPTGKKVAIELIDILGQICGALGCFRYDERDAAARRFTISEPTKIIESQTPSFFINMRSRS
jgi:predicted ester cyclase